MTLNRQQFQELRNEGLSVDQIVKFDSGETPQQQPQQNSFQKFKGGVEGARDIQSGLLKGAGKGLLSTLTGASSLGEKFIKGIGRTVTPKKFEERLGFGKTEKSSAEQLIPESFRKPEGTAEKIGFGAEQIAEFALPATKVAKLKTGASLAKKVAIEAGAVGAQTSIQEGEVKKGAFATGALLPVAGKVLSPIVKKIPETAWSSILKQTPTAASKNKQLSSQIADKGLSGVSRESLSKQFGQKIQSAEVALDDLLRPSKKTILTKDIVPILDDLQISYANVPGEQNSLKIIGNISDEILAKGESLTVLEANKLKRDIYGLIKNSYGKGLLESPAKTTSQKLIASRLKTEIEKQIPLVKDINQQQAIYIQARNAIEKTIARESGKGLAGTGIGLFDVIIGTTGIASLGLPGLGIVAGKKFLESPVFLSNVSKLIKYFNTLSPTKRDLFMTALRGLSGQVSKELP